MTRWPDKVKITKSFRYNMAETSTSFSEIKYNSYMQFVSSEMFAMKTVTVSAGAYMILSNLRLSYVLNQKGEGEFLLS